MNDVLEPWREEAQRHGFRLLEQRDGAARLQSGATFLDLAAADGAFSNATLKTWIDAGKGRWALVTYGVAEPRPRPPGAAGWLAARVVAPLMQRMVPPGDRPVLLKAPEDLRAVIEKHMQELLAVGGKPVQFAGDALAARREQERRDDAG